MKHYLVISLCLFLTLSGFAEEHEHKNRYAKDNLRRLIKAEKKERKALHEKQKKQKKKFKKGKKGKEINRKKSMQRRMRFQNFVSDKFDDPKDIAWEFIQENPGRFGFIPVLGENIEFTSRRSTPGGDFFYFRQVVDGIPVHNSLIIVTVDFSGKVTFASNNYQKEFEGLKRKKYNHSRASLEVNAREHFGFNPNIKISETEAKDKLMWVNSADNGPELAHFINLTDSEEGESYRTIMNITSGEVIDVAPTNRHLEINTTFHMSAYDVAPATKNGVSIYSQTKDIQPYCDNNDQASPTYDAARINTSVDVTVGVYGGKVYLHDKDIQIWDNHAPYRGTNSWTYQSWYTGYGLGFNDRDDNLRFEAGNVYWNLHQSVARVKELGFWHVGREGLRVDPHGNKYANSWYQGLTYELVFGVWGVDHGEDPEIIFHEHGHAIIDRSMENSSNPNNDEASALQEGGADYWALTRTRGLGYEFDNRVVAEHGMNGGNVVGYEHGPKVRIYPRAANKSSWTLATALGQNGAHLAGQLWSTVLMEIWEEIGKDKTDALWLAVSYYMQPNDGFLEAASHLVEADIALYNGTNLEYIIPILNDHGLYDNYITHQGWTVDGSTLGKADDYDVQGSDGADDAYFFPVFWDRGYSMSTCHVNTGYDTKLEIFHSNGSPTGYYNDDQPYPYCSANSLASFHQGFLPAGGYWLVVDGYNGDTGDYRLQVW